MGIQTEISSWFLLAFCYRFHLRESIEGEIILSIFNSASLSTPSLNRRAQGKCKNPTHKWSTIKQFFDATMKSYNLLMKCLVTHTPHSLLNHSKTSDAVEQSVFSFKLKRNFCDKLILDIPYNWGQFPTLSNVYPHVVTVRAAEEDKAQKSNNRLCRTLLIYWNKLVSPPLESDTQEEHRLEPAKGIFTTTKIN